MSKTPDGLTVELPSGGYARSEATRAVRDSDLPKILQRLAPGPFGTSSQGVFALEALGHAVDHGLAAAAALEGLILKEAAGDGAGFAVPSLAPAQRRLVAAFQLAVTADAARHRLVALASEPDVSGALELDGFGDLLDTGKEPAALATRVLRLAGRYIELHAPQGASGGGPGSGQGSAGGGGGKGEAAAAGADARAAHVASTLVAFLELLRRATVAYSQGGDLRPMTGALAKRKVLVAGYRYDGLQIQRTKEVSGGLLPVGPSDVVGNREYLEAGLRLARDVAGFDFATRRNPKKINPVLFGLGRPGCGKTITAHAVGNYFLEYCKAREIPARFQVIRRTDWASSYQNASAANLVRIFKEEIYGFEGVSGVYWADIDTALASRGSNDLRMEEKQNLGAVFGIFDGTLLPKDGKWFLICDANTMHMDEAAVSRIAQNPFTVRGPTTVEHYVTLMRDLMLKDVRPFVPEDPGAWERLARLCVDFDLSGRVVDSICGNIRARVQDFEYPDDYFKASAEERQEILARLSNPVDEAFIEKAIRDHHSFQKEAAEKAERDRFEEEVSSLVRQLNASRAAAERAVGLGVGAEVGD
ncbi:MAG: AAA family ATPase [Polyangia bacterium]|jgi:hypothetical protein|nr:AAA family ATPase [Polyangia bacterium]